MRILQITDFYRPIIGGLERHVQTLAQELARRGHQVSIATLAHPGSPAREDEDGVRIYRLRGWQRALSPLYQSADRRFHPPLPDPGVVAALRTVIRQERPQVIHAHSWMLYSVLPLMRWSKARLVVTLHDYGLVCAKKTYMHHEASHQETVCTGAAFAKCLPCARAHYGRTKATAITAGLFASRRLHRRVDRFLAVSSAVAEACASGAGPHAPPIAVVPTFIPDSLLHTPAPTERPVFLPRGNGYLLFVGVLSKHKGLHILLDAYAQLPQRPPLVLIGTPYGDAPTQYPEGVHVAHNVPHAQVMAAWNGSALGVVPSIWPDPSPQVIMEAMAAGKPLIASHTGGIPDLVRDGETGVLVPPGDANALSRAIEELLRDPLRRARMGKAAQREAQRFLASAVTARIEAIYAEVVRAPARK
ncbi:MAG TPA: glycosyltransferase family 4 protein [Chloroflexota bacterium]|nr:glycosyltransferase family 4 protein [Chloroflexota bacterium]